MNSRVRSFHISPSAVTLNLTSRIDGSALRRRFEVGSTYYRVVVAEVMGGRWDTIRNMEVTSFFPPMDPAHTSHKAVVNHKLIDPEAEQKQDEEPDLAAERARAEERRVVAVVVASRCWRVICQSRDLSRYETHNVTIDEGGNDPVVRLLGTSETYTILFEGRAVNFLSGFVSCPFCGGDHVRDL